MTQMSAGAVKGGIFVADRNLPKIDYGKGVYLYDMDGRQYIDGSSGPAAYSIGHGNEEVNEAIARQLARVAHGFRYLFTSDPLEELTELIRASCGADLSSMVFVCGGSEAVESALKLALQYHSARGEVTRRHFISRHRSWHGNTLGALSVSDFLERRRPFEGALRPTSFLSAVNAYRPPKGVALDQLAEYCATELEEEILRCGPETVAAFIFEPVVGAAGGVVPAPDGYAARIRQICDRFGVLMIADEVMCGSGRCGTWRALEQDGVAPDIMTIAKGLAGGYQPLGAAVYSPKISDALTAAYGGPLTGHTFTGHTAACAAGAAVQRIFRRERLVERVRTVGPQLMNMCRESLGDLDAVGDIRGRGFFVGIEFVADRKTKAPFPAEYQLYLRIRRRALERGLICYPCGGNVDGIRGDTVIVAPPYVATESELGEIVEKLGAATRAALAELRAA